MDSKKLLKERKRSKAKMKELQSMSTEIFNLTLDKIGGISGEEYFSSNLRKLLEINHNYRIEIIHLLEKIQ